MTRFCELCAEIDIFLNEKNRHFSQTKRFWKLAFTDDLIILDEFNLRWQGEVAYISDMHTAVKAFRQELIFFESQQVSCRTHLPYCYKFRRKARSPFPLKFAQGSLPDLKLQFQQRFSDLEASKK